MTPAKLFIIGLFAILATTNLHQPVSSAKILTVSFFSSKSHKITYERLLEELASRGHQLTILNPFVNAKPKPNIKEIKMIDVMEMFANQSDVIPNRFDVVDDKSQIIPGIIKACYIMNEHCIQSNRHPAIQELLASKEKFDLIIWIGVLNECSAGFVHKMNTSTILISPISIPSSHSKIFGTPTPTSFVPNLFSSYSDRMTLYQRFMNLLVTMLMELMMKLLAWAFVADYREAFNDWSLPDSDEVLKNVSLVLSNSHYSLNYARPFLPDIIEVGGMHCRPAEPLPKDLEDFVKSSDPHGFIYFSMGSMPGDQMHDKHRKILLGAFSKLKQKVLWKWDSEKMDDLPPNVKLTKWAPQQDILGHPKLKMFITHGGLGSITEAVYHGSPLIGMPLAADQSLNMEKAETQGIAIKLDFQNITADSVVEAVQKILTDPSYKENMKRLSNIFTDQLNKPLDRAVYWVEYVIRHKGAVHLRSPSRDLSGIQYHSLDVYAILAALIFTIIYIKYKVTRFLCRKLCGCFRSSSAAAASSTVSKQKKKN